MEDWEEEAFSSVNKAERTKSSWNDEDEDENDVKESWEEDGDELASEKLALELEISKIVVQDSVAKENHQERFVDETSLHGLIEGKSDEKTLNNFIPKSANDFSEYASLISHKLHLYENNSHYTMLLKAVISLSISGLQAGDAKEVAYSVAAIANEKLKLEKDAINAGKRKTGAKKKQLNVDKENDDAIVDAYDDYDLV